MKQAKEEKFLVNSLTKGHAIARKPVIDKTFCSICYQYIQPVISPAKSQKEYRNTLTQLNLFNYLK